MGGNHGQLQVEIEAIVSAAKSLGDTRLWADALITLAGCYYHRTMMAEAEQTVVTALNLIRNSKSDSEVNALVLLGRILLRSDLNRAANVMEEAYTLSSSLHGTAVPHVLLRYGEVLGLQGTIDDGVAMIKRAGEAYEARNDLHGKLNTLLRLCVLLQSNNQLVACLEYAAEAVHLAQDHTNPLAKLNALKFLAGSLTALGRFDEAFDVARRALEIATMQNDVIAEADCLGTLGMAFYEAGDLTSALSVTQQAFHKYSHAGAINGECLGRIYAARIYATAGDMQQAQLLIDHALDVARSTGNMLIVKVGEDIRAKYIKHPSSFGHDLSSQPTLPNFNRDDATEANALPAINHALDVYRCFALNTQVTSFGSLPSNVSPKPVLRSQRPRNVIQRFSVILLGGFRLQRHGVDVPLDEWKRRKARDVFKFLVLRHRQSVPVDTIVEHLWSADANVDACLPTLQNSISIIRSILEPDLKPRQTSRYISHVDGAYVLDLGAEAHVDVEQFRASVTASRTCEHPPERRRLLEQATALYTGSLLPEDAFEEWTSFHRSDLHALCIEAYDALASVCFELNDRTAATAAMRAAAALDDGE